MRKQTRNHHHHHPLVRVEGGNVVAVANQWWRWSIGEGRVGSAVVCHLSDPEQRILFWKTQCSDVGMWKQRIETFSNR